MTPSGIVELLKDFVPGGLIALSVAVSSVVVAIVVKAPISWSRRAWTHARTTQLLNRLAAEQVKIYAGEVKALREELTLARGEIQKLREELDVRDRRIEELLRALGRFDPPSLPPPLPSSSSPADGGSPK